MSSKPKQLRSGLLDAFLIALAATTVLLSLLPTAPPRQTLIYRSENGDTEQFALATDRSEIAEIQKLWDQHNEFTPTAEYSQARWSSELADYYASRTSRAPNTKSVPNTKSEPSPKADSIASADQAHDSDSQDKSLTEHAYWVKAKQEADQRLQLASANIQASRKPPPPVRFGVVLRDRHLPMMFIFASIGGLLLAVGYFRWMQQTSALEIATLKCKPRASDVYLSRAQEADLRANQQRLRFATPPITNSSVGRDSDSIGQSPAATTEIAVRPDWLHVRQPARVKLRRAAMAGAVIWALLTILF